MTQTSVAAGAAAAEAPSTRLAKDLRQRHVTMISIGGIIGAGLFVGSSAGIATVGPAIVVSYLLAGVVVLLVMRMLGEMAAAFPETGAFTEFARLGLGDWAGFTAGWLYWYFWVVVVAFEALTGALVLQPWLALPAWLIALVLVGLMLVTNLWSAKSYGEFEFWFASIKVAAIIAFIAICAGALVIHAPAAGGPFANLTAHGGFAPFGALAVLGGVTSVVFQLCGAEIATIAAAESDEPSRAIARMTSQVVLRILLFYVGSLFLIVTLTPWTAIKVGVSPFVTTLERLGAPGAPLIMKFIILTAVLSCLNSGLYVTSRVLFTLAARRDAPASLVALNARKVPVRAILFAAAFAIIAGAASVVEPTHVWKFLLDASGALMLLVYGIVALAQIRLRRRLEREAPERLVVRMWFYPFASWFAVATILAILAAMALSGAQRGELFASLVVMAIAVAAYFVVRRRAPQPL